MGAGSLEVDTRSATAAAVLRHATRDAFCSNMSALIIAPPLAGHVIGSIGDAFVIAEWQDAGGPAGPPRLIAPRHLHHSDDEAWYVLEGALRVQVGKDEIEAGTGSSVFVPRGTPHTYWNAGPGRVRYLLVMTSNIYRLIQEIHVTAERSPAALRAVFTKYDSELLDQ
jgi:mannose-6-phosphate isomerase-like protein (cupin superfamily)